MSNHSICLKPVCRLCGLKQAIPKDRCPYSKETYQSIIKSSLCLDITSDVPEIHPPFICYYCVLKLKRWRKEHSKKRKVSCNIEVANFEDFKCLTCTPSEVPEVPITLDEYMNEARKNSCLVSWFPSKEELIIIRLSLAGDVEIKLTVSSNFTWSIVVAGVTMHTKCVLGEDFGESLKFEDWSRLCSLLVTAKICKGNSDFPCLVEKRKGPDGQLPLKVTPKDVFIGNTIRHTDCSLLVPQDIDRCKVCKIHRADLCSLRSAYSKEKTTLTVPNKFLSNFQLCNKATTLQSDCRRLKRRSGYLEDKIKNIYSQESLELCPQASFSMESVMEMTSSEIEKSLPMNSAAKLLWEQQQSSFRKGKQMRWHPAIIRWCIAVHNRSSSAYNLISESGFLRLPHPNTLQPYSHFAGVTTGFCHEMLDRVVEDINLYQEGNDLKKHVVLLFDEMKVKSGLFFSVSSGKIIGTTDVGNLANEMHSFERKCRGNPDPPIATHVLVLMLRGLFSNLHVPIAYYPTTGASGCDLYMAIWEAVEYIEVAGFVVHALVSDGASPNRKFYRLHSTPNSDGVTYKARHQMDQNRNVYFYSDVPHLLKTLRNNLENSGYNNKTRNLHYNKQDIKWNHLLDTYNWDVGMQKTCPGLRMLHKWTYEHLHLTPSSRMRVYMAAQVLSSSAANTMEMMGRHDMLSTIKFLRMVDQFFDCLNVSNLFQGKRTRKPALEPYRTKSDWRFKWLQDDFLGFFKEWEAEVNRLEGVEE
ncbi:uncharacterized protein LOC117106473, partial [Anneissia japonica]|uniref:uncharacterized protein LOC117106473 n=1 Tax=Anneissia japonica TaxID=1529436 RepID=UPI001425997A